VVEALVEEKMGMIQIGRVLSVVVTVRRHALRK
jgi:hypothetical protein